MKMGRRDVPWLALIGVSFCAGLAASWERWGNPLVDCGREMNQPLRLARGEMLYSDVRHIYGPLSPYLNAVLYRIFAPSLWVLYADGIVTAALIMALVYLLARRFMKPATAAAATLSVMWLCAFKQAGNYILPYSFSALHGCMLGLAALVLTIAFIDSGKKKFLVAAGLAAGLTALAKTEMGAAAFLAGALAALLAGRPRVPDSLKLLAIFALPAAAITVGVYWRIAALTGLSVLSLDSFLFLRHLPPELVYFNKRMSGLDQPLQSLRQMIAASIRFSAIAGVVAAISLMIARRRAPAASPRPVAEGSGGAGLEQVWTLPPPKGGARNADGRASIGQICLLLSVSVLAFALMAAAGDWDQGPYMGIPFLLIAMLAAGIGRYPSRNPENPEPYNRKLALIVVVAYALLSLTRVILRVRSGGAYSSYLLPASVVLFTYCWVDLFPALFRDQTARRAVQRIALGLILADVGLTAVLISYRFRTRNTYAINTPRGTMVAVPDLGKAFDEAQTFISRETSPGEPVAVMPEGTSLNFFTDRPNPLREEITTPGFLDGENETRAISELDRSGVRLILVSNRPTPEFGAVVFGRDYCRELMAWVDAHFDMVAVFGPNHDPNLQIGDKTFFMKAYRRK
jgi:hypothetical protein